MWTKNNYFAHLRVKHTYGSVSDSNDTASAVGVCSYLQCEVGQAA